VLLEQGAVSVGAYAVHIAAAHLSNDQLSDLEVVTLARLAKMTGRSVRTVSRYRRELIGAGLEEHEHRCYRKPDGTIMGLPNRIRFSLPDDAAARVAARAEAANRRSGESRRGRTTPKGRATPRAPQNQPPVPLNQPDRGQADRAVQIRNEARRQGHACPVCEGTCMVETPAGYVPCEACDRTGIISGFSP
jgi:hypothetical protein